jgi:lipopolysaccharide export system protein LptA
MKTTFALALLVASFSLLPLHAADKPATDKPIDITSDETKMENGIAYAVGHAQIAWRGVKMTADKIEYTVDKRTAQLFSLDAKGAYQLTAVIDLK